MERFETRSDNRRAWRRVPVGIPMQCRRLARSETDVAVDVVDLSPGGVRLRCGGLVTGDVVVCSVDGPDGDLRLKGLVVQNRVASGGAPFVHVAWTDVSPAAMEGLGRLLDQHEAAGAPGAPPASGRTPR
ncbi:MAG: PilZ domain-containing protein [Acidimicrobiales bacterium]